MSKCLKCGSSGDDLIFNFYCSNKKCENYKDENHKKIKSTTITKQKIKSANTSNGEQDLFDATKKNINACSEVNSGFNKYGGVDISSVVKTRKKIKQEIERLVSYIIKKDILICQTRLVEKLFEECIIEYDDIINFYPDPYLFSNEELEVMCDNYSIEYDENDIDNIQTRLSEYMEPQDIYEWWSVTDWLADKLENNNEPILRTDCGTWWGRTCTGQAISLDGTIQRIVIEL